MAPPPSSSSSSSSSGHIGQALRALSIARAQSPVTISQYGRVTTGAQLLQDVASLSSGLRTNLLLQPGDRVAIASLNRFLSLSLSLCMHIYIHFCLYIYICVCVCVCIYVCIYIHIFLSVCVFMCMKFFLLSLYV